MKAKDSKEAIDSNEAQTNKSARCGVGITYVVCYTNDKQQSVMVAGDRCKAIAQFVNPFPLLNHP